jgi:hypothetical protein
MSKTVAIVLSVIGGLVLLGIIIVGGFAYWVYKNKEKFVQSVEQPMKEGKEFGAKTNNIGCLNEALSRHKRDKSIMGRISTTTFLGVCLDASSPSPGFCDDVPARGEIMKSSSWAMKKCSDAGLPNDQGCLQLLGAAQAYCHKRADSPEK